MTRGHWRCVAYAVLGLLTGCAAYAQDSGAPSVASADTTSLLFEAVRAGGLPSVLALMGWTLGRGGIPITVQLSAEDRDLLKRIAKYLAKAVDDRDDSVDSGGI